MAKLKSGTRIYGTATIDTSVVVGSGVTITTNGINVVGVVTATDFNSASDLSLKTNIQSISNPIDKILQINGVTFNWRESNKPSVGIIAQEIEKIFPELVNGENPKTVNYNGLIGLLIEAIKATMDFSTSALETAVSVFLITPVTGA